MMFQMEGKFQKAGRKDSKKDTQSEMLNPEVNKRDDDELESDPTDQEIPRGKESDKGRNEQILKTWENQRKSWRELDEEDTEVETEFLFGMVYSPPSATKE